MIDKMTDNVKATSKAAEDDTTSQRAGPEISTSDQGFHFFYKQAEDAHFADDHEKAFELAQWLVEQPYCPALYMAGARLILAHDASEDPHVNVEQAKLAIELYEHAEKTLLDQEKYREYTIWALERARRILGETEVRLARYLEEHSEDTDEEFDDGTVVVDIEDLIKQEQNEEKLEHKAEEEQTEEQMAEDSAMDVDNDASEDSATTASNLDSQSSMEAQDDDPDSQTTVDSKDDDPMRGSDIDDDI